MRWGVLVAVFVLGAGIAWILMPTGAWLGNDSLTYVGVARNMEAGEGVTSPFAHELSGVSPDDQVERLAAETAKEPADEATGIGWRRIATRGT